MQHHLQVHLECADVTFQHTLHVGLLWLKRAVPREMPLQAGSVLDCCSADCVSCCEAEVLTLVLCPAALLMWLEKSSGSTTCPQAINMHRTCCVIVVMCMVAMPAGEMMRLKKALEQRAKAIDIERTLHTPKNTEAITILKRPQHLARVGVGSCITSWCAALSVSSSHHEVSAP